MPQLENNITDDPISLDGDVSFSGGQASNVRKNAIKEGAFDIGINTDFDTFGNIVTRKGVAQLVGDVTDALWGEITDDWTTSPATTTEFSALKWSSSFGGAVISIDYFGTPTIQKIVVAEADTGSALYRIKIVGSSGAIDDTGGTFNASATAVYFAQMVDRMYYCDGISNLAYVDSSSSAQSITAGKVTSVELTTQGLGYTSAPTVTFSAPSSGVTATGTANLGYGGKVISVTITNQGSGYDNSGAFDEPPTITIAAPPTGGTQAVGLVHISQTPSKPRYLISHTNRLFCATGDTAIPDDTIYVSDILDGDSWDIIGNSIRVGDGTGDPITAIASWYSYNLLVFKERSVWVVEANPEVAVADWPIKLINNRVGCVAHKSVQQVGPDVFFLSNDGVRSLSTIEAGAQTDVSTPISAPINDQLKYKTEGQDHKSSSAFFDRRYILSMCVDGATSPNRTFIYSTEQEAWSGFWTGWKPNDFTVTGFDGKSRLQFADNAGSVYTWLNFVELDDESESYYLDQTTPYETELVSRAYNFKELYASKMGYQVEFDLDNRLKGDQNVSFFYLKDMDGYLAGILQEDGYAILTEEGDELTQTFLGELAADVPIGNGKNHFVKGFNLLSSGKFDEIQFVAATDSGRLSLHSIKASAFVDTINPER